MRSRVVYKHAKRTNALLSNWLQQLAKFCLCDFLERRPRKLINHSYRPRNLEICEITLAGRNDSVSYIIRCGSRWNQEHRWNLIEHVVRLRNDRTFAHESGCHDHSLNF